MSDAASSALVECRNLSFGYGQRLSLDDRFDAGFNLSAVSPPYDGDRELDYRLVFDLSYRF